MMSPVHYFPSSRSSSSHTYNIPYVDSLSSETAEWKNLIETSVQFWKPYAIEMIVAFEGRGMIMASVMSYLMGVPLIPFRKAGKLPGDVVSCQTSRGVLEIHREAVEIKSARVLIVDGVWGEELDSESALHFLKQKPNLQVIGLHSFYQPQKASSTDTQQITSLQLLDLQKHGDRHHGISSVIPETFVSVNPETSYSLEELKKQIRTIPDFPIPGILFRDISTLLNKPSYFRETIHRLYHRYHALSSHKRPTKIVGLESRGFLFGAPLAYLLKIPFLPVSKKGKIPVEKISVSYKIEYGFDEVEMAIGSVEQGDRVLVVDDLIATGGTAKAACELVRRLSAEVMEVACVIELPELKSRERLRDELHVDLWTMVSFEGH
jgi:adenine phosphoribosyltransferase